jgi:hypothetical protein
MGISWRDFFNGARVVGSIVDAFVPAIGVAVGAVEATLSQIPRIKNGDPGIREDAAIQIALVLAAAAEGIREKDFLDDEKCVEAARRLVRAEVKAEKAVESIRREVDEARAAMSDAMAALKGLKKS